MSELIFHFLNVGKGNCTVIEFPSGRLSVIDIDDSSSISYEERYFIESKYKTKLTDPIDYICHKFSGQDIFRFILTHPDMDHLSGIKKLFSKKTILNFWDTDNNKFIDPDSWENSPYNKEDWDFYREIRKNKENPKVLFLYRNDSSNCCWIQDGIKILSPTKEIVDEANRTEDYDHLSYILMIEFANRRILLCGDATLKAMESLVDFYRGEIKSDILLAPNHGSKNHISKDILDFIDPQIIVVSVKEGIDYARDLYSEYGKVLSTKYYGDILIRIKQNGDIFVQTKYNKYSDRWYYFRELLSENFYL